MCIELIGILDMASNIRRSLLCGPRRGGAVCWHEDMVCLARTGTCAFPTEVDISDKTVLERYSYNWGNLSSTLLQRQYATQRKALRKAAPDQSGVAAVAEVDNRDFPIIELRLVAPELSLFDGAIALTDVRVNVFGTQVAANSSLRTYIFYGDDATSGEDKHTSGGDNATSDGGDGGCGTYLMTNCSVAYDWDEEEGSCKAPAAHAGAADQPAVVAVAGAAAVLAPPGVAVAATALAFAAVASASPAAVASVATAAPLPFPGQGLPAAAAAAVAAASG